MSSSEFNIIDAILKRKWFFIIFLCILIPLMICLLPFAISIDGEFVVTFSIILFSFCLAVIFSYLICGSEGLGKVRRETNIYEIALAIIILVVTFPLLTESYLYFDDWWVFDGQVTTTLQSLLRYGRPFQSLVHVVFGGLTIENVYILKWIYVPILISFSILLFRWLSEKNKKKFLSFFIACILSIFGPAMDILGYTSTSVFLVSILFTAFSVICIDKGFNFYNNNHSRKKSIPWFLLATLFLFSANFAYQIGPQIFFLFLAIELYFNIQRKFDFKKYVIYALLFGFSNGIYLFFFRVINWLANADFQTNRSEIISSIGEIKDKVEFYWVVLKQSLYQIFTSFTGNLFVSQRYHGYYLSFKSERLEVAILIGISLFIIIGLIGYLLRTKNILGSISLVLFIPMTYYGFLLLSESSYLTYYGYSHISILLFYFLMGIFESMKLMVNIIRNFSNKIMGEPFQKILYRLIMIVLLIIVGSVSNLYIRDFYITYNNVLFEFIKNSIFVSIDTEERSRIHIFGTITPLNADVYSRFVVNTALRELGKNPDDYQITSSKYKSFLERIEEEDFLKITNKVSSEECEFLLQFYKLYPQYRQYNLTDFPSEEDQKLLRDIFIEAEMLPEWSDSDTIIIDITWTKKAYYNP